MIQDIIAGLLLTVATYCAHTLKGLRRDMGRDRRRTRRWFLKLTSQHEEQNQRITRVEQLLPNQQGRAHGQATG